MLQWVSITLALDFLCANIGAMGLQKLWTFQKRQIFFGLCLPWDPVLPPAMPGWRHGGKFVSTLLGSSHSSSLAYSTFRPFSAGLHLLPARGRAPGHQTGGGVWLEGWLGGPRNPLPDWTFYSLAPPQKHTQTLCSQTSLLPRVNLKRRERSFTEYFNIILSTHAKPLTSFLKHRPHILNFENMFIGNSRFPQDVH